MKADKIKKNDMKKVAIISIALSIVAAFVVCGKAFTQKDVNNSPKSVKALAVTKAPEPAEATISYSAAYNDPDSGADPVEVAEDTE